MDLALKNRKAIISGANRGIGRSIALAYAAEGVHLALLGRNREASNSLAQEIARAHPDIKCVAVYVDLEQPATIGPAVEASASFSAVPVLRVDQPMADEAVQTGQRIGVIATLPTTLNPTRDLVQRRASAAGKSIELSAVLVEGAFEALMAGDAAKHDGLVAAALRALASQVDVIVLAQASMARVVDALAAEDKRVPIYASPGIAVDYLATVL